MRKLFIISFLILITFFAFSSASDTTNSKKGWGYVPLPAFGYNSDLGYSIGVLSYLYNYGDGTIYPDYLYRIYFELSAYTALSGVAKLTFDSKFIIPGIRITSVMAYYLDKAHAFYGFNGYKSVYNSSWEITGDKNYHSRLFYAYQSKNLRFMTDLQGTITNNFYWLVGIALWNYRINPVDIKFINSFKSNDLLPSLNEMPGLYDRYVAWNIIKQDEKNGGFVGYLKTGIIYDSRDFEPNPTKGIWTEFLVNAAPWGINKLPHVILTFTHRQYFQVIGKKLVLACRLGYQGKVAGRSPFYIKEVLNTSYIPAITNAVGGDETVRGLVYSRILSNGFVYSNLELRWRMINFRLINQNVFLGTNFFFDAGMNVNDITIDYNNIIKLDSTVYGNQTYDFDEKEFFKKQNEKPHFSAGSGIKLGINENTVISIDAGNAFNPQDGGFRIYFGMDFLF